jgi:hypothetical protein
MAYQSRHFSQAELDSIVADADRELDNRAAQARQEQQLAQLQAYMNDPYYKSIIDNNETVKAIRALPTRQGAAPAPAPTTQSARPATGATLPAVIDGDARFHPVHMRMKPAASSVDSVIDSYVFSPGATIRQR